MRTRAYSRIIAGVGEVVGTMKIVVAGASGFLGAHLVSFLNQVGHETRRLVRGDSRRDDGDIPWNPAELQLDPEALRGTEAIVCLSGTNVAGGRWTPAFKQSIRESRIQTVSLLAKTISSMDDPPETLICASAVGYYGCSSTGEQTESSPPGEDFLAQVCVDWEAAAQPAVAAGIRVVQLRLGVVLDPSGGSLGKMLLPFKLALGGRLGDGEQYMSWTTLDEAVGIIDFALQTDSLEGPVNATSPHPATNREFTRALAKAIHRPAILPIPKRIVRGMFGEMGDALLLSSIRAVPAKLEASGYRFRNPDVEQALKRMFQRNS